MRNAQSATGEVRRRSGACGRSGAGGGGLAGGQGRILGIVAGTVLLELTNNGLPTLPINSDDLNIALGWVLAVGMEQTGYAPGVSLNAAESRSRTAC